MSDEAPPSPAARERLSRPAVLQSVLVGDVRVSYLPDGAVKMKPRSLFPGTADVDWDQHADHLDDSGNLTLSAGALLVEHGDHAVLLDAGFGPYPSLSHPQWGIASTGGGAMLQSLERSGRLPSDIELVVVSHLHMEHVGWLGHAGLAHVTVLLSATEWEGRSSAVDVGVRPEAVEAIESRHRLVGDGAEVLPGVKVRELPGHTPGQLGLAISSGSQQLLAFADTLHSPVQVAHPEWAVLGEPSAAQSVQTRLSVLEDLAETEGIGFGPHLADVVFGRVVRCPSGYVWQPVPREPCD